MSLEDAQKEIDVVTARLLHEYPATNTGWRIILENLQRAAAGDSRATLLVLAAAVGCVLAIACANIAGLLLCRAAARRREIRDSPRARGRHAEARAPAHGRKPRARGGGRNGGTAPGALGSPGPGPPGRCRRGLGSVAARSGACSLSPRLLVLATGLAFGLGPALASARIDPQEALQSGFGSTAPSAARARKLLVAGEVAVAVLLLTAASLFLRSLRFLMQEEPGFRTEGVLTFSIALPTARYDTPEKLVLFHRQLAQRLAALPGAQSAGAINALPLVVRSVLLKPLGFPHPERLVQLQERGQDGTPDNTGFPTYQDWRSRAKSFEDVAVMSYWTPTLAAEGGEAEKLEGLRVSDGFFRMLGVHPILGRDLRLEEDRPNANRVVLLSHGLWKRRFGGDTSLPGKTIQMGDRAYLVAGILPPQFESVFSPFPSRPTEIWAPLGYDLSVPYACRNCRHLRAFARLRPGVTFGSARAEMASVQAAIVAEHPADYPTPGALVNPLEQELTTKSRPTLWTLLAAVGFVLLIACANVASLLVARASGRQREVAIRCALGADRRSIARLFLTEALLIASAGGLLGVAAAGATLQSLLAAAPAGVPRLADTRLDIWVLGFAAALSLGSGLVFGLAPAVRLARLDPEPFLREGSGGSASRRSRRTLSLLVAFDAALVFVLLFGAGLLVKSTSRLLAVDPGFDPAGVLQMEVSVSGAAYRGDKRAAALTGFYEQALDRIRALPGVVSAGATSQLPLGGNVDGFGIHIEGRTEINPELAPSGDRYSVTPDYLATMRIPLLRGRGFTEAERADAPPVALINQTLARKEFSDGDPIGRRFRIGDPKSPWRTIVGVVGDVQHAGLDAPKTNQFYMPHSQFTDSDMVVVIRTAGDPASIAPAALAAIHSVDRNQPVARVATVRQIVTDSAASRFFAASLSTAFAVLAVLLAAVGVFGVVSSFVARRFREIGIRIALGARRGQILRLVAGQAVGLAAAGVAVAIPLALGLGSALKSQLYAVSPGDGALLACVGTLAVGVALVASLLPARRAMRISPLSALRSE